MTSTTVLLDRNRQFARDFTASELPMPPKLGTVLVTCGDARVDPAHVLGLELGDVVVIRNNGGRVTTAVMEEIAALTFLSAKMGGDKPSSFELILMQHTQCGAERFADPGFQKAMKQEIGVDVSKSAIVDHEQSLRDDIEFLRNADQVPGYVVASGLMYDVKSGLVSEIIAPAPLAS